MHVFLKTAKEFLRNRWAQRSARPFTPIEQFIETIGVATPFNPDLSDACRLGPDSAAEVAPVPSAATLSTE